MYIKISFLVFFSAAIAFADDCNFLCGDCENDESDICKSVIETCNCNSIATEEETIEQEKNVAPKKTVKTEKKSIIEADFGHNEEMDPPPKKKRIIDVNFGENGDDEYTAVRQADGSYEIEERSNTGIIIASAIGAALLIIILLAI